MVLDMYRYLEGSLHATYSHRNRPLLTWGKVDIFVQSVNLRFALLSITAEGQLTSPSLKSVMTIHSLPSFLSAKLAHSPATQPSFLHVSFLFISITVGTTQPP